MQLLFSVCQWLAQTMIGTGRESDNLFSAIETVHVLGITVTAGTIAIVDLRVLGIVMSDRPVSEVIGPLVKITWIGFAAMTISGSLLFWSEADKLYSNSAFRVKLVLLVLAGVNQWIFHAGSHKLSASDTAAPTRAKLSAGLSLGIWIGVIVLGRSIAYV